MSEEIPLEELAELPEFYHPVASPDGEQVALYWDETGRNELYVRDLATGELDRLSDGEVPESARWPIMWSGDGERVYYHRDRKGDEQNDVHALALDGTHEVVVEMDGQCVLQDVGDDDRFLYFTSTAGEQMNLYRRDDATGEVTQLTAYEWPVQEATLSPDGDAVAFVTNESEDLENRDAYLMDADGGDPRRLDVGVEGSQVGVADWAGPGLLVSDDAGDLRRPGVYDPDADEVEWLGTGEHDERPVAFTPDGEGALVHRFRRGSVVPVHYDLETGEGRELAFPEGVGQVAAGGPGGTFTADGEVLVAYTTAASRKQLYRYDLEADERAVVHEAEYGDVDPSAFVDADHVTYESEDGLEVGALLYDARERAGADGDERTPAVVHVHGGPHAVSLRRFDPKVQFLVDRGYTVFQPNYRGSLGRGREFKNAIHGDWGGMEQVDVAEGGRWLMDREWVDADRVAVFGGSYGGYSTYMQLVKYPRLWAAGIASVGITDLHELYEEDMPHFKAILREQMGDPGENDDLWRERSPVEHVEAIERPLLIVHGLNDPRCPITQARIFREALEQRRGWTEGEEFEYEELDVGHGSTDAEYRVTVFRLMEQFLDERL